jgi:hypothetical protein
MLLFAFLLLSSITSANNWLVFVSDSDDHIDTCDYLKQLEDSTTLFLKNNVINMSPSNCSNEPSQYANREDITPENFINVLTGVSQDGKKVLNTTADDGIAIYYRAHTAPLLCSYADKLNQTLRYMYSNSMYKLMVFYFENCECCDFFDNYISPEMNIWVFDF